MKSEERAINKITWRIFSNHTYSPRISHLTFENHCYREALECFCIPQVCWGLKEWGLLPFSSVQSLSHVRLFATPWTATHQASLSITNSRSPPKHMSIESVMPSIHLILCRPLLLLPSIFPSIRVFSNESALCIRWPKYWSLSFNISPTNEHPGRPLVIPYRTFLTKTLLSSL